MLNGVRLVDTPGLVYTDTMHMLVTDGGELYVSKVMGRDGRYAEVDIDCVVVACELFSEDDWI